MSPEDWIQAIRFGSKSLYPLSGLARPLFASQVLRLHVRMFEPFCPALKKKSHKAFQWRVNERKLPSILCKGMWWSYSWKQKGFKFYINTLIVMYFPCLPQMSIYFIRPKHSDEVTWTGCDIFLPRGTARSFQLLTKCGSTHRLPFGIGGREWAHLDIPKHPTKKSWSPLLSTLTQFKEKPFNKCPHIAHQSSSSFSILYSCLLREQSNYMKSVFKTLKESWERCKSLTWPQTHRHLPVSRIPSAYPMFLLPPCSVLMVLTLSIWNSFHNCNLT